MNKKELKTIGYLIKEIKSYDWGRRELKYFIIKELEKIIREENENKMARKVIAPSEYFLRVVRTLTGEPRVEDELKLEPVEGKFYPFEYKGIQLFAHRSVSFRRFWTVSEKQSGLLVTKSFDTREEAIAKAKEAIDSHPIKVVREFIRSGAKDIIPFVDRKEHLI